MPVKSLNVEAALPVIGTLYKGAAKPNPRTPGHNQQFFRFVGIDAVVQQAFEAAYGPEPSMINIRFPYEDRERCVQVWMEEWDALGLVHRCDEETMVRWRMPDGTMSNEQKPCPYFTGEKQRTAKKPGCVLRVKMLFQIPEISQAGIVGVVRMTSGGWGDAHHILGMLDWFQLSEHGQLADLRLPTWMLSRYPVRKRYTDPAGQLRTNTASDVFLMVSPDWVRMEAARRRAMANAFIEAHDERLLLPAGPDRAQPQLLDRATGEIITLPVAKREPVHPAPEPPAPPPPASTPAPATPPIPKPPVGLALNAAQTAKIEAQTKKICAAYFGEQDNKVLAEMGWSQVAANFLTRAWEIDTVDNGKPLTLAQILTMSPTADFAEVQKTLTQSIEHRMADDICNDLGIPSRDFDKAQAYVSSLQLRTLTERRAGYQSFYENLAAFGEDTPPDAEDWPDDEEPLEHLPKEGGADATGPDEHQLLNQIGIEDIVF